MIAFQLDQCLDSKRFVRNCTAEGICQLFRLPPPLRGAEDPQLLASVMAGANPLVTFDRALAHDHTAHIPQHNGGEVTIGTQRNSESRMCGSRADVTAARPD